ncbi:MAG: DHH family phosphoesterase [Clostridia bacterium]|nr:DHH family phosphoesterase [Clostridia bacterium]
MEDKKTAEKKNQYYIVIAALAGLLFTVMTAAALLLLKAPDSYIAAVVCVILCGASETAVILLRHRVMGSSNDITEKEDFGSQLADVIRKLEFPVTLTSVDGKIMWVNEMMLRLYGKSKTSEFSGLRLEELTGRPLSEMLSEENGERIPFRMGDSFFTSSSHLIRYADRDCWLTVFDGKTDLVDALTVIDNETAVIGYAVLDNLAELAQFVKVSSREATDETEKVLRKWITGLDGFMVEYSRDKYIFAFPRSRLRECIESNFDILSTVRHIELGDGSMSVTVSMGISSGKSNHRERELDAKAALDTALQRGGDQVVLHTDEESLQFGGNTKSDLNRTKIRSRVTARTLRKNCEEASNVIIMGHKNPDFDCIGSCIGLYKLASLYNREVKIVTDSENTNFRVCTAALLEEQPEYSDVFVSAAQGQDLINSGTFVIIVDVNNLKIVEAPEIVANVADFAVIDHHRKTAEFDREPVFTYIEPGTSSCCELVAEMIEASAKESDSADLIKPTKHEATVMLSGIMLDTKNFTRTTNGETFAAAYYLREAGGSSEIARTFFYNDYSGFVTETKLESSVRLYRDRIAITVDDLDGDRPFTGDDRVSLANAADSLLTVRNVDAAFSMLVNGDSALISARSGGKINVQLIMEKLGGGGHYDSAGAQISGKSPREVIQKLKHAIDLTLDAEN